LPDQKIIVQRALAKVQESIELNSDEDTKSWKSMEPGKKLKEDELEIFTRTSQRGIDMMKSSNII
jgi:hypothetical protein